MIIFWRRVNDNVCVFFFTIHTKPYVITLYDTVKVVIYVCKINDPIPKRV